MANEFLFQYLTLGSSVAVFLLAWGMGWTSVTKEKEENMTNGMELSNLERDTNGIGSS